MPVLTGVIFKNGLSIGCCIPHAVTKKNYVVGQLQDNEILVG